MEAMRGSFAPRVENIEPDLIRALKRLNLSMALEQIGFAGIEIESPVRAPLTRDSSLRSRAYSTFREFCDRGSESAA
jgi:hypothetical protein